MAQASLRGVRIGVLRKQVGTSPGVTSLFDKATADLKKAGAVLVDIQFDPDTKMGDNELAVMMFELRKDLGTYLAGSPAPIAVRSLQQVIAFDDAHPAEEMRWFGQELFLKAAKATDRAAYLKARAASLSAAGAQGIDRLLKAHNVRFLIAPTAGPAWTTDLVNGDHYEGSVGAGNLPAIAGYPHLSVPMGSVEGLPVGLSIIGPKWSDAAVLRAGAAYEGARTAKLAEPTYPNTIG
jgi:amidase